ncbi:Panacea domain-containing protein [Nonomuraea sp. LPB2021202275-12-8]|uniref:Panacea domain-containing protein n=1 Tax=Nonomuraea sp. LPB2021202275-12-8 TaxID=3120159 RepID=UPI00300C0E6C
MKLQKLLYYAQGHHLATFGQPLFNDTIMAWDMGPVVPSVWQEEKYGSEPWLKDTVAPALGEAELNTIGYVLSRYGNLSGKDLESLSHSETPWKRANAHRPPRGSARIEVEWIEEFFRQAADDTSDDEVVLDSAEVAKWLSHTNEHRKDQLQPDDLQALRARLVARG